MFVSIIRFISKGWIYDLYIKPKFYFPYYGFEWVKPLGEIGMYLLFAILAVSALFIMLGLFYRISAIIFFLGFTYVELIDKTNYLNHYYFVSIISLLLICVPANGLFSFDALLKPSLKKSFTPSWSIDIFKLQLGIVYFYAGLAKLNYDWLVEAMPLRIWLPAHNDFPIIGFLFEYKWIAYFFSWFGALYDLSIPFILINKKTRWVGFILVLAFHLLTVSLFPIGMFPYIMILSSLIFFSSQFHQNILTILSKVLHLKTEFPSNTTIKGTRSTFSTKLLMGLLAVHFIIQLLVPLRFLLYPDKLFWTEQGYRFSWRVMLMEKAGVAFFYITDPKSGDRWEVTNRDFLTVNQEKMMATQPDMILQFAHHLEDYYQRQGIKNVEVRAESMVTLNGRESRSLINPSVDLTNEKESFKAKNWITSFEDN
jgi:hypothetical protein